MGKKKAPSGPRDRIVTSRNTSFARRDDRGGFTEMTDQGARWHATVESMQSTRRPVPTATPDTEGVAPSEATGARARTTSAYQGTTPAKPAAAAGTVTS